MSIFDIFNNKLSKPINTFDNSEVVDLLLIREKYNEYTELYFRENGVPITKYFRNFDDVEIALLMGNEKTRLVIIEEGLGDFITMANRNAINSLVGMCDGENKRVLIFYINSLLKSDTKIYKHIDYRKFNSTQDVIDTLKRMGEIYTDEVDNIISREEKVKTALRFRGEVVPTTETIRLKSNNVVLQSILSSGLMANDNNLLESFKVKF